MNKPPELPEKRCGNCKFFDNACRRNAPSPIVVPFQAVQANGPPHAMAFWPLVQPEEPGCGEWKVNILT